MVKESENDKWKTLDYRYMTEESDDESTNKAVIVQHKLPWHSDSKYYHLF